MHNHSKVPPFIHIITMACVLLLGTGLGHANELTELLTGKPTETAAEVDKVIAADNTAKDDKKIKTRLENIFNELDELQGVQIHVSNGVVTLSGEVSSSNNEQKAIKFARQVEGVVEVENELIVNREVETRIQSTLGKIIKLGQQAIDALPLFLLALLIFSFFWWIGGFFQRQQRFFQKIAPNAFIASFLGQIVHLVFIIVGIILALILLDATGLISTILGAAGIVGLAVGFAVRDTVENYISSILLSIRNPFEVNDFVDIEGNLGKVVRLTSRATILLSSDGNHIRIPNAMVFKAVIINYTRNPERRFEFDIGVSPDHDLSSVQALALEALRHTEGVLSEPKATVIIHQLGDSSVIIRAFGWVNQQQNSLTKVRSEAIRVAKNAFDDAGIVMPEPTYNLKINGSSNDNISISDQVSFGGLNEANATSELDLNIDHHTLDDVRDIRADKSLDKKVNAEQAKHENLLTPDAPIE